MKISSAICILTTVLTIVTTATASNITYNVISLVPSNQTVGVIVDDQLYPLTSVNEASTLLHTGEAPMASTGYRYAVLLKDNYSVIDQETFSRQPVINASETLNEYYGRSWNSMTLSKLPTIMSPLPIINRLDSDLHIDGEIPTIHLFGNQSAIDYIHGNQQSDIDITLNMTYISPKKVKSFEGVTVAISGHSTRYLPKLSYKFELPKKRDLFDYRRFKLRAMDTDISYMREKLGYEIAESVGLPTTRYSYVRLYINDQAIGLFGLAENFKNPWIRNEFANGSKEYNQGTLFVADVNAGQGVGMGGGTGDSKSEGQAPSTSQNQTQDGSPPSGMDGSSHQRASADLSYLGDNATLYSGYYDAKEDPSTGTANYTRIMDLTKFISEQSNATTVDNSVVSLWQSKIDTDSVLRTLALEVVLSNMDGYLGMGNNYILYDDLESERLIMSTQDLDLTMGTSQSNRDTLNIGNYTQFTGMSSSPLTTRLLKVPQFKQEFEELILNFTIGLVNTQVLTPRINQLMTFIGEDVAWDKKLPRVGKDYYTSMAMNVTSSSNFTITDVSSISLETAVNGPVNVANVPSLKEWIALRSNNTLNFFNRTLA